MRRNAAWSAIVLLIASAACQTQGSAAVDRRAEQIAMTFIAGEPTATATLLAPTRTAAPTRRTTATPPPTRRVALSATPTAELCNGVEITERKTATGIYLSVRRCSDGMEYELGPLAVGVYRVGPNQQFLAYVSNDGLVYAAKIGETRLTYLGNVRRDLGYFQTGEGAAGLAFSGEYPYVLLVVWCPVACPPEPDPERYERVTVRIPRHISH